MMIVENLEEYQKETKKKKTVIINSLEESFDKLIEVGCIPEIIVCDALHRELFKSEIRYFSVRDRIIEVPESFTVIAMNGHELKVLTRIEMGEGAFRGIELYGRCK